MKGDPEFPLSLALKSLREALFVGEDDPSGPTANREGSWLMAERMEGRKERVKETKKQVIREKKRRSNPPRFKLLMFLGSDPSPVCNKDCCAVVTEEMGAAEGNETWSAFRDFTLFA